LEAAGLRQAEEAGMMERDWLNATDPQPMLAFLRRCGQGTDRKFRLAAVACCRRMWHSSWERVVQDAVEVAERYADGRATPEEMRAAERSLAGRGDMPGRAAAACTAVEDGDAYDFSGVPLYAASRAFAAAVEEATSAAGTYGQAVAARAAERASQAALLRDLFGPLPFREVCLDPSWLLWNEGVVRRLAEDAYEQRVMPAGTLDPQRLAVLADALEEVGAEAELVANLRGPGPHYRGNFVLDLLLGKQ
jgi:hypothetical protein